MKNTKVIFKLSLLLITGVLLVSFIWQRQSSERSASEKSSKNVDEKIILTPKPGLAPHINGPRLFGVRPGRAFIYRIPCTGKRPMTFEVMNLPEGLNINKKTGIISGNAPDKPGNYLAKLKAQNDIGEMEKDFTIVVGNKLALTPPMGWNSWYIHYQRVTDKAMRQAADMMVESGMADAGYMYVNIDDCWMRIDSGVYEIAKGRLPGIDKNSIVGDLRDENGNILPNNNFPDMKSMTNYIHGKGLRAGIYTTPGPRTCQKYAGSYQYEQQDAEQYAAWGFDFLKYDWCSYGEVYQERMKKSKDDLAERKYPYQKMGDILKSLDRDIILNLCQYSKADVWTWGDQVGHCWRTTGDLGVERASHLPGFYQIGMRNAEHWHYAKPGAWNDPDYILIGWIGSAYAHGIGEQTTLTDHEQYSYMSMWSLMAAPLFFSGDMAKLDEFTLNILCNSEVIDINQDALGNQAKIIEKNNETLIMAKPMEDGSLAVGLFNLTESQDSIIVKWDALGIKGFQKIRDVWRQKDLGEVNNQYSVQVARHGVMLVRFWLLDK